MEEIFICFLSADENVKREAIETLNQLIIQQNLIIPLLEFLSQHLNDNLTIAICIVLVDAMKRKYMLSEHEQKQWFASKIFELYFLLPEPTILHIAKCIEYVLSDKTIKIEPFILHSVENLNSKSSILQSLEVLSIFFSIHGSLKEFYTEETEQLITNVSILIESILHESIANISHNIETIKTILSIFISLWRSHSIFLNQYFSNIIGIMISLLPTPDLNSDVVTSILSLIDVYIDQFLNPLSEFQEFTANFTNNYAQQLLNSLLASISSRNQYQRALSIKILSSFIKYNIFIDQILNHDVLISIIFPALLLTEEDIQTFENIPEQFLSFATSEYSSDKFQNIVTPRQAFLYFIDYISKKVETFQFLEIIKETAASELFNDIETRAFVLSSLSHYSRDNEELLAIYLQLLSADNEFIISDSICGLIELKIEKERRLQISIEFLDEKYPICIKLLSAHLFQSSFTAAYSVDIEQIIGNLLNLSSLTSNSLPGEILCSLNRWFPDQFSSMASDICGAYINAFMANSDNETGSVLLDAISRVIESMDSESEDFLSLSNDLIDFVGSILNGSERTPCDMQMINLLFTIVQQSKAFNDLHIKILQIITNFESLMEFSTPIMKLLAEILMSPGLQDPNVFNHICEIAMSIIVNEPVFESKAEAIFVLCGLVQVTKSDYSILDICNQYINTENNSLFFACISLLSSGFVFIDGFAPPNDVVEFFVSSNERFIDAEPSIGYLYVRALSMISVRTSNTDIANLCVSIAKRMKHLKDCEDNFESLDIDEISDFVELPFHHLISDQLDVKASLELILNIKESLEDQEFIQSIA